MGPRAPGNAYGLGCLENINHDNPAEFESDQWQQFDQRQKRQVVTLMASREDADDEPR